MTGGTTSAGSRIPQTWRCGNSPRYHVGRLGSCEPSVTLHVEKGISMSTLTQSRNDQKYGQSGRPADTRGVRNSKAWVARAAKKPMAIEAVDLGPLGAEEVEAAVE